MTLNQLASAIAKKEGKKSQVAIGNIREILKILVNLEVESVITQTVSPVLEPMTEAVNREFDKRQRKKPKKKKK